MHGVKSLTSEYAQADVKNPDQSNSRGKARHDKLLSVLHHFSQQRMRSQIEKTAADVGHD
jgi:hypothetical protein